MTTLNSSDMPCYENAQRLARVETKLEIICKKLDDLIAHPCSRCQNNQTVTRLVTEMKIVKWAGGLCAAAFLGTMLERIAMGVLK